MGDPIVVDPIPETKRRRTLLLAKVITVALVGASAGLITLQGETSVETTLGAIFFGLLVGAALVWYLFPSAEDIAPASARQYRK